MNKVLSHNHFHLGDNLIFLHLLRSLAKQHPDREFVHFTHAHQIPQLIEAVQDLPAITLKPFESYEWQTPGIRSVDTWKNAEGFWERSANRWDWSAHILEHHAWTAKRMGFESPFTRREHLLFDAPLLQKPLLRQLGQFDFFLCDAKPSSGQFSPMADHSVDYFQPLLRALLANGKTVISTETAKSQGFTLMELGELSNRCNHHIMVASGPMWGTMNTFNHHHHEGRRRIVLLDNGEQLNMPHIEQCSNIEQVMQIAKEEGWI